MPKRDQKPPKDRAPRADIHAKGAAHGRRAVHGTLANISAAGAFLRATRTLAVGEEVTLSFNLPVRNERGVSNVHVTVRAEVRHRGRANEHGVGVQFVRMSRETADVIQSHLKNAAASKKGNGGDREHIDVFEIRKANDAPSIEQFERER